MLPFVKCPHSNRHLLAIAEHGFPVDTLAFVIPPENIQMVTRLLRIAISCEWDDRLTNRNSSVFSWAFFYVASVCRVFNKDKRWLEFFSGYSYCVNNARWPLTVGWSFIKKVNKPDRSMCFVFSGYWQEGMLMINYTIWFTSTSWDESAHSDRRSTPELCFFDSLADVQGEY